MSEYVDNERIEHRERLVKTETLSRLRYLLKRENQEIYNLEERLAARTEVRNDIELAIMTKEEQDER